MCDHVGVWCAFVGVQWCAIFWSWGSCCCCCCCCCRWHYSKLFQIHQNSVSGQSPQSLGRGGPLWPHWRFDGKDGPQGQQEQQVAKSCTKFDACQLRVPHQTSPRLSGEEVRWWLPEGMVAKPLGHLNSWDGHRRFPAAARTAGNCECRMLRDFHFGWGGKMLDTGLAVGSSLFCRSGTGMPDRKGEITEGLLKRARSLNALRPLGTAQQNSVQVNLLKSAQKELFQQQQVASSHRIVLLSLKPGGEIVDLLRLRWRSKFQLLQGAKR